MATKKIAAAVLSLALLGSADAALACPGHHHSRRAVRSYSTSRSGHHYSHYYSRTRGTAVGAVAGALIDRRHPLTGAIIGGTLGNAVQYERSRQKRH